MGAFWLETAARLKPRVSLAQAQQEMTAIAARLGAERPEDRELGVALVGLRDQIAGPFRPALVMLTAAVPKSAIGFTSRPGSRSQAITISRHPMNVVRSAGLTTQSPPNAGACVRDAASVADRLGAP